MLAGVKKSVCTSLLCGFWQASKWMLKAKKKIWKRLQKYFLLSNEGRRYNDNIGIILESIICSSEWMFPQWAQTKGCCAVTKSKVREIKFKFQKIWDRSIYMMHNHGRIFDADNIWLRDLIRNVSTRYRYVHNYFLYLQNIQFIFLSFFTLFFFMPMLWTYTFHSYLS